MLLEMMTDEIELVLRELAPDEIAVPDFASRASDMLRALQGRLAAVSDSAEFDQARDEARRNTQAALYGLVKAFMEASGARSCEVEVCQRVKVEKAGEVAVVSWFCRRRGKG